MLRAHQLLFPKGISFTYPSPDCSFSSMCLTNPSIADATAPLCSLSASPDACHDVFINIAKEGQLCVGDLPSFL